ncbi:N-acetyl-gamma-glutamyl-phosphate reductase [Magnetospirillum molischianum]|uniref:N-acetyl-gamma-glutamyl-phosphate reductase n=1 Tax=Magnetospirillum molischianum DSM 120 TaxID=1150626 RepID=H8FRG1_MAGML|nr:N-acetyl-gamma-glutamyl-phosphate reductase [Magnetospirillum molischianum]CCG40949.1 putative N-acetyl-gamma-glutamyl-phosphate reductase, chloroplastic [Magnetospirillum molischianum DSM 120]
MDEIKTAILGASGYTGAELLRFLAGHPAFRVTALTADRKAGQAMAHVFPHFAALTLPDLVSIDQVDFSGIDAVFCCLPHGTTQDVISTLPASVKVCDLSADFRLRDVETYARWYGHPHQAPELQKTAVYGLTELARPEIRKARLVANPGCYPTSAQLPLIPLLRAGLIKADDIIIDAMSGVSGAGRAAKEANLYTEVAEGIHPYGIAGHRHAPEIEQGLSDAAGRTVDVSFTPHLMPMNRGMLSTIHVRPAAGVDAAALRSALSEIYRDEPFVRVLPDGGVPATRNVRGSNLCLIGVFADRVPGRAILVSAIDNLVKGASGQALQNMNLMFGLPETMGLDLQPLFP